jgi:glycosyltransferase involved in cell wall biosynthesis
MLKVSVIIPFVNEWPQIVFTLRSVKEELEGVCDYEIIAIDNWCKEVEDQGIVPDRGHDHYHHQNRGVGGMYMTPDQMEGYKFVAGHIFAQSKANDWLKCVKYNEKLSHWNSKNVGVKAASGDLLIFLDAHVVPSRYSLRFAIQNYNREFQNNPSWMFNTVHLPLSYHILESKRLIYKLVYEPHKGNAHYSFTTYRGNCENWCFEVPCMSTCGMIMHKELFRLLGGWPEIMGIYGGGENFINFTMAILGFEKYVSTYGTLHHHGDKRDYHYNWNDYHRNRMTATAIFGGREMLHKYQTTLGGSSQVTEKLAQEAWDGSEKHRNILSYLPKISMAEFAAKWGTK